MTRINGSNDQFATPSPVARVTPRDRVAASLLSGGFLREP